MYRCRHFKAHELVSPSVYKVLGESSYIIFDAGLLRLADALRDRFGSCTINNWYWGGDRLWSGYRTPDSPHYRELSRHSQGKALDMIFNVPAEEVRQWIKNNVEFLINECGLHSFTIEEGVNWVHIQVDNKTRGLHSFTP